MSEQLSSVTINLKQTKIDIHLFPCLLKSFPLILLQLHDCHCMTDLQEILGKRFFCNVLKLFMKH